MLLLSLPIPLASLRERLQSINLGLLSPLDSVLLSLDSYLHEASLPPISFISNHTAPKPLAFKLLHWSHFRYDSFTVVNDHAGSLDKLLNDTLVIDWMLGLARVLVAGNDVV